jgi:gluconate kinase
MKFPVGTGLFESRAWPRLKNMMAVLRRGSRSGTARRGHFATDALLESQFATLEEPGEEALTVDGAADVDTIIGHIRLEFGV